MTSHIDGKIYNLTVDAHLVQATTAVKFPCLFFVQWRTNDQKSTTQSAKHSPQGQKVAFNQTITLKTTAVYDRQRKIFVKKQTQLQLNLISKSRPDQPKLVGRVTIDLATLLNDNPYKSPTQLPLQFCSVNAFIVLSFKAAETTETDISVNELQKSISQGLSFASSFKPPTPHFGQQRSGDSLSILKDQSSASSKSYLTMTNKKQYSNGAISPRSNDQRVLKDTIVKQVKDIAASTSIKDIRQIFDDKSRTASYKTAKKQEEHEAGTKKYGSFVSEEPRQHKQIQRLKNQLEHVKLQNSKRCQDQERNRLELQKKIKQCQFAKLQLRQKQGSIDQASAQIYSLRNDNTRLRQQSSKAKEESIKLTIKLSELVDTSNRTSQQLSTAQRELKRYQTVNQTLNQSNDTKRQMAAQILTLQRQLSDSETKSNQLNRQKLELQQILSLKDLQYKKKYEEWNQQKTNQSANKENLLVELFNVQEKLKSEVNLRQETQDKLQQLQVDIKKLTSVFYEFQQAKNSWEASESLLRDELDTKTSRVSELEEAVISAGDRVRWLEGQIQLMAQNNRQTRQQYLKVQQQKEHQKQHFQSQIQKAEATLRQYYEGNSNLQKQKTEFILSINSLFQKYQSLTKDYQAKLNQQASLTQEYEQLSLTLRQNQQRCSQFEELLLSANQQRQKQLFQAGQRQKNAQMCVLQLESQLRSAQRNLSINQERLIILKYQLQNRQDLLLKLEESLKNQIERSQSLNIKLLGYMERAEKMKDIMVAVQQQKIRITGLIAEQQLNDNKNKCLLQEKDNLITELLVNLEQSNNQGKEIQWIMNTRQTEYSRQLQNLNGQIMRSNAKLSDLENALRKSQNHIVFLQSELALRNQSLAQKDDMIQKIESDYNYEMQQLNLSRGQLQSRILDLEGKITSLNEITTAKRLQLSQKAVKINQLSEELLLKEVQNNNFSFKIQELDNKIRLYQNQLKDFESQILLKQSHIQEEKNRYSQLAAQYNALLNEQTTFDIQTQNDILKQRNSTIAALQTRLKELLAENAKIASLQRSLKIKTIQLNSMKFKGKGQANQSNELVKLKDQEIASLIAQNETLLAFQIQCARLQLKINALQGQLQLIEEEKFNIESEANQKALILEEARQENKKLMEQITIIGQKHSELQKLFFQLSNNENGQKSGKTETVLKTQNMLLKTQINQLQNLSNRMVGSQMNKQKLADQTIQKKTKKDDENFSLGEVLINLRGILNQRLKNRLQDKLLQSIDKKSGNEAIKDTSVKAKIKSLSKDYTKLKALLLKVEVKSSNQKLKFIEQLKDFETLLNSVLDILE